MFTEGLDPNALRWVREGSSVDSVHTIRNGRRNFVLPSTNKFRSGHLPPTIVPLPHSVSEDADNSCSFSDMGESSDTEEEAYRRSSLDSSPGNESQPCAVNGAASMLRKPLNFSGGSAYIKSMPLGQSVKNQQFCTTKRNDRVVHRYPEEQNGSSESEYSAGSSDRVNSHPINISSQAELEAFAEKDFILRDVFNQRKPNDPPSAPPFKVHREMNQGVSHSASSMENMDPSQHVSSVLNEQKLSNPSYVIDASGGAGNKNSGQHIRTDCSDAAAQLSSAAPARMPVYHASGLGPWHSVIAYDACVRLCLHSWARGCTEAPFFLENECAVLRNAFGLDQILLQSEEELLSKRSSELVSEATAPKPKKMMGKMKVQVRKLKMSPDIPSRCSFSSLSPQSLSITPLRRGLSNLQSTLSYGWDAFKKVPFSHHVPVNSSFSGRSIAYMQAGALYIKQVSTLLKVGVSNLRSTTSDEIAQELHCCKLRLKSSAEEEIIRMQPGRGESHVFFPDSLGDELISEVYDSKGDFCGRAIVQVAAIAEDSVDKLRWWPIYHEPDHELIGRLQLHIAYAPCQDESSLKCGSIAETVAYDLVLEVAMKTQHFRQRNLLLHGNWKWLIQEFASYFGVSDAYTRLRYLSYVMDVATPTADCLNLVYDLLAPVILKGRNKSTLSHQENRILGDIEEQINQLLGVVFENYKSLDESAPSGLMDIFKPATGSAAPALSPALKLFSVTHDVLSSEAQMKLCGYFQIAARKRSRMHMVETDEFVTSSNADDTCLDAFTLSTAYQKVKALCLNIRNEIFTDIQIHNKHILPSFIELPNICASIYSVELCNRLRAFLVSCPPSSPCPPVAELVIATSDFQRDLESWNIGCTKGVKGVIKGGVDAKELFHLYIILWIQDKRLELLNSCKLDRVKWSGVRTQHCTTPFVDEMYDRLKDMLTEYDVIIRRWPEYIFVLENAIADVEKTVLETLDKQYADVLAPLKEALTPKKFGIKYVQKLAKRSGGVLYTVPEEVGILLNTLKRLLDVLRPRIESQLKSWASCIPGGENSAVGEKLSEITVLLRAKFRNYQQAVVEKLVENTRVQNSTKLKKIIQDSKENVTESDVRSRMQPLREQLLRSIDHLYTVLEAHVFVAVTRGYWDRMGQIVLNFLENRKENKSWYKSSRIVIAELDHTFASQMQQLLGNTLQEKDLEAPRSIVEVRSMLCKDACNHRDSNYYY